MIRLHPLACAPRRLWLRRRWHLPFWRDDKTAAMLGIGHLGCPLCGRGSIKERDRLARAPARADDPTGGQR